MRSRNYVALVLAASAAFYVVTGSAVAAPRSGLMILVDQVRNTNGFVRVEVCDEHEFLKSCKISGYAKAVRGTTAISIEGLPKGTYAAQVFHDENANHRVDRGLFGVPKEGVGFSNDFKIGLRAPKFAEAAFAYAGGDQQVAVHLKYYFPDKTH
jgi:uncharacterized protein (DUF2141 family)